jgi:hypothetical protein
MSFFCCRLLIQVRACLLCLCMFWQCDVFVLLSFLFIQVRAFNGVMYVRVSVSYSYSVMYIRFWCILFIQVRAFNGVLSSPLVIQCDVLFCSHLLFIQVRAFNGAVHVGLGGNVSVAAGPLGRHADATIMVDAWWGWCVCMCV